MTKRKPGPGKNTETWTISGPGDKCVCRVTTQELDGKAAARIAKWLMRFAEWDKQRKGP